MVKQMMIAEGMTEELKEVDQMEWIWRAIDIRGRTEEIVQGELIYR